MKRLAWSFVLVGAIVGSGLRAQAPRRLPIIAGNGMVHVLAGVGDIIDAAVGDTVLLLKRDGTVLAWGWGTNANGELCDGTTDHRPRPVQMKGISNAVDAVVEYNSIVVLADGTLRGWGMGYYGALGDGGYAGFTAKPHPPTGLGPVLVHYMSGGSSYAIRADGTVMAWCIPTTSGKALFVLLPTAVFTVKLSE